MASGTLGTLFILQFIAYWNGYEFNLIYLPSMPTIAYGIYRFSVDPSNKVTIPAQFAASISLAIPMIILFACTKEKILGSISIGGLKG
jgi:ABC-type glycerol-3-phosphate transport system permease component